MKYTCIFAAVKITIVEENNYSTVTYVNNKASKFKV